MQEALRLKEQHRATWRDEPETYWLARLIAEIGELSLALCGDKPTKPHHHNPDMELAQIAAIVLNWLEMREDHRCTMLTALGDDPRTDGSWEQDAAVFLALKDVADAALEVRISGEMIYAGSDADEVWPEWKLLGDELFALKKARGEETDERVHHGASVP